ncbi:MAG: KH domain-containing protein [Clostridia bacterium]|nr:KH domain-containing protein [Clostridia bacterium]
MRELVEYIARHLVDDPDQVRVTEKDEDDVLLLEVTVAPDDMGRIIGRQGRIAKAIRTLVKAGSLRSPKKYIVEIV